jgi:predicted lipoprotein with Yx(FWY)xxD motif
MVPALRSRAPAETAAPAAIKISSDILADKNGMPLYTFDKDVAGNGKSACDDGCAAKWHALFAADAAKDMGKFVVRNDVRKQWAIKAGRSICGPAIAKPVMRPVMA